MRELRDRVPANSDPRFVTVQHDFDRSDACEAGINFENIRLAAEDIRVNFSALPMKWESEGRIASTLSSELEKLVDERFRKDIEITQLEVDLRRILFNIHITLQEISRTDPDDDFKETASMLKYYGCSSRGGSQIPGRNGRTLRHPRRTPCLPKDSSPRHQNPHHKRDQERDGAQGFRWSRNCDSDRYWRRSTGHGHLRPRSRCLKDLEDGVRRIHVYAKACLDK
jgi:hypothetical protein